MDSTQSQAATSSSPNPTHTDEPSLSAASESKVLRTSARVKAAKQKEKQKERPSADSQQASSSSSKRARDSSSNKGKGKEVADESRASKRYVRSSFHLTSPLNKVFTTARAVPRTQQPPPSPSTNPPRIPRARSALHPKTTQKTTKPLRQSLHRRNSRVLPVPTLSDRGRIIRQERT